MPTLRKLLLTLASTALVASALVTVPAAVSTPAAGAATRHTVKHNVPKPSKACNNHGTLKQGAWLANKPCGYVVGTALAGQKFDAQSYSGAGFGYGRAHTGGGANFCAWILPKALAKGGAHVVSSCSKTTSAKIHHRRTIGRDFDYPPHQGNGKTRIKINASACTGYYNYFTSSSYTKGKLHDRVGFRLPKKGGYRYTTNDRKAAMIHVTDSHKVTTWLFVSRSCIAKQLKGQHFSNVND